MTPPVVHPLMKRLSELKDSLTPKGRIVADYVLRNPTKTVFMTAKELSVACGVGESTVIRFVGQLGYGGYGEFIQTLRDMVDTELTLLDRVELSDLTGERGKRFRQTVLGEIENLKQLFETIDMETLDKVVDQLEERPSIYVIGSRLSYTLAYYMGWSLTKFRSGIHILKGSDSTTIDRLTIAPPNTPVVIIATSRYPNELIRLAKLVRRLEHQLIVIADSSLCPLIQFSHLHLIAPSRYIPLVGSLSSLSCLINYLILELVSRRGKSMRMHQEKLEQTYLEHDILFNLVEINGQPPLFRQERENEPNREE